MVDVSTTELVALHLLDDEGGPDDEDCVSFKQTTPGIVKALDVDDTISGRVELLTTLESMKEVGLIEEDRATLEELAGQRNRYQLTSEGRALARDVAREVDDVTIVVDDSDRTRVRLGAIDEAVSDMNLGEALARTTDAGVLHRRDDAQVAEGIVAREPELASLQDCIDAVQDGTTRPVFVAGKSGIGKTTLVERALEDARDRDFTILTGTATEDATQPYLPVSAALAEHRETFPSRLFEADAADLDADVANLEDLTDRRRSLFSDVGDGLTELAADQPVTLFLDDLHVADPGSLALLEYLATSLDDEAVLLVGAYRPEEIVDEHPLHALGTDLAEDAVLLDLGPLDESATRTLIERTLDDRNLPGEFVDQVHARTGGHPLFVEATVRHLREQGVVDPGVGHYPADPDLPLPQEVRTAIERRLSALDDTARSVIDVASVVGTSIDFRVLAAVTNLPEADLREYVDLLVASRVWTRKGDAAVDEVDAADADVATEGGQYAFTNEVVRDAVREQLSDHQRRQLHDRVAEALEEVHTGELAAHAGTIAPHYERGGDHEQAIEYYRQAGDHAASVYAHETAIDTFERALVLARERDHVETVLTLLEDIGQVHFNAGEWDQAERYFEYLRERTDDPEIHWEIAGYRAIIHLERKELETGLAIVEEALARWDGDTSHPAVCNLLNKKGWALLLLGDKRRAREFFEAGREMADDLDHLEQRSRAINGLAPLEADLGNVEHAHQLYEDGLELADELDDEFSRQSTLNNFGLLHTIGGNLDAAQEAFERSIEINRKREDPEAKLNPLYNLGLVLTKRGEREAARNQIEAGLDLARELDNEGKVASARTVLGHLSLDRGDLAAARKDLDRALERFREVNYAVYLAITHSQLARLKLLKDAPQTALEHATAAHDAVEDTHVEKFAAACAWQGRVYRELDRLDQAIEAHETGLDHAQTCQSTEKSVWNRCGLALACLLAGEEERALDEARRARQAAAESQYALLPIEARLALGRVQHVRGAHDESEATLQEARSAAHHLGVAVHECEALYELGSVLRTQGDARRARDSLEASLELAKETGATLFEHRCESALEQLRDERAP